MQSKKILITIPVRNRDWCFAGVLESIREQNYPLKDIGLFFLLNDSTDRTRDIIEEFTHKEGDRFRGVYIEELNFEPQEEFKDHTWTKDALARISELRNQCIMGFNTMPDYDAMIMMDSDYRIHTNCVKRLVGLDLDLVAENSWSTWGTTFMDPKPHITDKIQEIFGAFSWVITQGIIDKLRKPGLYKLTPNTDLRVGTCIYISRPVTDAGVNFRLLEPGWDEQRSFCYSAQKKGFDIYMDTTCEGGSYEQYKVMDLWTQLAESLYLNAKAKLQKYMLDSGKKQITVLDVGCGVGFGAQILKQIPGVTVIGLDVDEKVADLARLNSGIQVISADLVKFKTKIKFDAVISCEVIEHVDYIREFLQQMKSILKDGGFYFISTPNSRCWRLQPEFHIHRFVPEVFERIIKDNFQESPRNLPSFFPQFDTIKLSELNKETKVGSDDVSNLIAWGVKK